jgi:polyhydroxybutyrate depolymerase
MRASIRGGVLAIACVVAACGSGPAASGEPSPGPGSTSDTTPSEVTVAHPLPPTTDFTAGGARPVTVRRPANLGADDAAPLLVLLHGYGSSGAGLEDYLPIGGEALARGMVVAAPDGTAYLDGSRFWNATDACCGPFQSGIDDSGYLADLIDEIQKQTAIDPRRIYAAGHSNGGFMSYRMACDHAELVAAITSISGAMLADPAACQAAQAVAVLHIHGTADRTVPYLGNIILGRNGKPRPGSFPGAEGSVAMWAGFDGCGDTHVAKPERLDLVEHLSGADGPLDTTVTVYDGCRNGSEVELWSIEGADHIPSFSADVPGRIVDFLLAHPKPA